MKKILLFLVIFTFLFTNVFSYDSDWRFITLTGITCGCNQPIQCPPSGGGFNQIVTNGCQSGDQWAFLSGPGEIVVLNGTGAKKDITIPAGNYYLLLKLGGLDSGWGETLEVGFSNWFGFEGRNVVDLGEGDKTCIFKEPFNVSEDEDLWIKGTGNNSTRVTQYRITSTIPSESGLVYCDDGTSCTATNCSYNSWVLENYSDFSIPIKQTRTIATNASCGGTACNGITQRCKYYIDSDGDGFGSRPLNLITTGTGELAEGANGKLSDYINSCTGPPAGYVTNGLDCDDTDPNIGYSEGICPNGCLREDNIDSSYLFCFYKKNWQDSQNFCEQKDYNLVTINDSTENNWIYDKIYLNYPFWLGYNDIKSEGFFEWVWDLSTYQNWDAGEPNNFNTGEDCTEINRLNSNEWNDIPCDLTRNYICERKIVDEICNGIDDDLDGYIDEELNCGCEELDYKNSNYLFCKNYVNWDEANTDCESKGYNLVTINDSQENNFIFNNIKNIRNNPWWIGYNDVQNEGFFEWVNNVSSYENWVNYQPDDTGNIEDCAEINRWDLDGWNDVPCNWKQNYVCEKTNLNTEICNGIDDDFDGLVDEADVNLLGEVMKITTRSNTNIWTTINLENSYNDPVVIFGPLSNNDSIPAHIRIKDVSSNSFSYKVEEWEVNADGYHAPETVTFIVLESGRYKLGDLEIEVGKSIVGGENVDVEVNFSNNFSDIPAVFTQSQTYNGENAIVTRNHDIDTTGFKVRLQEQESYEGHMDETIAYIAIEQGSSSLGNFSFEARITDAVHNDSVSNINLNGNFDNQNIIASIATLNGPDTAGLRITNSNNNLFSIFVEEETSQDAEIGHADEKIAYLIFDQVNEIANIKSSICESEPEIIEICNGIDDDLDGEVDEGGVCIVLNQNNSILSLNTNNDSNLNFTINCAENTKTIISLVDSKEKELVLQNDQFDCNTTKITYDLINDLNDGIYTLNASINQPCDICEKAVIINISQKREEVNVPEINLLLVVLIIGLVVIFIKRERI